MSKKTNITSIALSALILGLLLISGTYAPAQKTEGEKSSNAVEKSRKAQEELADLIENKLLPAYVFTGRGGSGVLISGDGYFLTNYHVVSSIFQRQGKEDRIIDVETLGGESHRALIVGVDPRGDIALLRILDADGSMPHLKFGNSDDLEVGQYSIAIGNPFAKGLLAAEPTVTLGVISAVHVRQSTYSDAIQTDAPINPGNSGGPLVTLDGKLVGINGRIETRFGTRASSGVGFAISSAQIQRFLPILKNGGIVFHGRSETLDVARGVLRRQIDDRGNLRDTDKGVKLANVEEGSPAEDAGLKSGDHIVSVAGYPARTRSRVKGIIESFPAGAEVSLTYARDGKEETTTLQLGSRGSWDSSRIMETLPATDDYRGLGTEFMEEDGEPVIGSVKDGSPAAKAGLKKGDVIKKINTRSVPNKEAALRVFQSRWYGETVKFELDRDNQTFSLEVQLPSESEANQDSRQEKSTE